jgi:hypothetical protein
MTNNSTNGPDSLLEKSLGKTSLAETSLLEKSLGNALHCDRCNKVYSTDKDEALRKQANDCASSIRVQRKLDSMVYFHATIDGPPQPDLIKVGDAYLQTFYGSAFDGQYYRFCSENNDIQSLKAKLSWIKKDACICDNCITNLIKDNTIEYAGES